jgi:hypothetical protein
MLRLSKVAKQSRFTSANGLLDAVFLQDFQGGAVGGGVDFEAYIVRKGAPVKLDTTRTILQAGPFTKAKLVCEQDHFLQIYYPSLPQPVGASACSIPDDGFNRRIAIIFVPVAFDSTINSPFKCRRRSRIPLIPTPVPCD